MPARDRFNTALQQQRCFLLSLMEDLDRLLRTGRRTDETALPPAVIADLRRLDTNCVEVRNLFRRVRTSCLMLILNNPPDAANEIIEAMYLDGTGLTSQQMMIRLRNRQPPIAGVFRKDAGGFFHYAAEP